MTRARHELVLMHSRLRRRFGSTNYMYPSPFLREIEGPGLVDENAQSRLAQDAMRLAATARPAHAGWREAPSGADDADPSYADAAAGPDDDEFAGSGDLEYVPGATVAHDVFGVGEILELSGRGRSLRLTIRFHQHGRKQLLPSRESLRIIAAPDD
jgi:hypothetical protein